jgi:hypothetical protein
MHLACALNVTLEKVSQRRNTTGIQAQVLLQWL